MIHRETILGCFGPDEALTNDQIRQRTGLDFGNISAELSRLRREGVLEYPSGRRTRPAVHRLAGAAKARAQGMADLRALLPEEQIDSTVAHAIRTQPSSVFHLARHA